MIFRKTKQNSIKNSQKAEKCFQRLLKFQQSKEKVDADFVICKFTLLFWFFCFEFQLN